MGYFCPNGFTLTPVEQLIQYFSQYIPLTKGEEEDLPLRITERVVKRRQFILQPGDVCKYYSFVVSGCFKMYAIAKNGAEYNLQFAEENDWIADIASFHSDTESHLFIEAIEASIILQVNKANLIHLYSHYPNMDRIFKVIFENKYVDLQNRVLQNISLTGEERYKRFLAQYPSLASRLPNTEIASYLGITPEFLSKIRKAMAGR